MISLHSTKIGFCGRNCKGLKLALLVEEMSTGIRLQIYGARPDTLNTRCVEQVF